MTKKPADPGDITEGKTVPPYSGRRKSAEPKGKPESTKDGAKTGGATGPVTDEDMKAPEPSHTRGGATGSPAAEKSASEQPQRESGRKTEDHGTGPSHHRGTRRAEDQS